MAASRKLRTAHFLMFIGVVPLVFAGVISIIGIASAQASPGTAGGSSGFLLMALTLLGYSTTVVLGGVGALWSLFLTSRHIDSPTTATRVLRIMVFSGIGIVPLGFLILVVYLSQH
jgi:hypothetical protein